MHSYTKAATAQTNDPFFWATLGRAMPDYEARREALRRLGRQVVW